MDAAISTDREKELFEQALDLASAAEQLAFLKGACGKDSVLLARVQALLEANEATGGFLPGKPAGQTTFVPVTEQAGDRIGRYKIRERIGEGGWGVVYVAEQEEPVRRKVALKIIKLGMDTRSVVARFEAERQALAMMDHPNIAKVLDAGATDAGRPYFVMELVRGIKITEYCDQNRLSTRQRLDLFIQVCRAVQHAHQKGIIHRDLKPSNILVTQHDGVPVPKVIDFGIAKATEGRLSEATVYTELRQFMGTPAYMSPEQAEMSGLDVDTRSDIYSLGVLLYELLTGQTPFANDELARLGLDEIRRTIREKEPVRPSTRLSTMVKEELTTTARQRSAEAPRLVHMVHGDLDWIVMKCLEKDRTRRYETATGLARDIERHLANEPVVARPPSLGYRLQKSFHRNKVAFTAGGLVGLAMLSAVLVSAWQARVALLSKNKAQESEQTSQRALVKAEEESKRADEQRARAEAGELSARQAVYAAKIALAQQALAANLFGKASDLLEQLRPERPGTNDLRGWEWRFLRNQCRSEALFPLGQGGTVWSLAVSSNGEWMAAGGAGGGQLSIWNLRTHEQVDRLQAGNDRVLVAFSPNRPWLAFSSTFSTKTTNSVYSVHIRDIEARQSVATLRLGGACRGLEFTGDGKSLVTLTASTTNFITVWSIPEGNQLVSHQTPLTGILAQGNSFAVAQDASVAAVVTSNTTVRLVDLSTGGELWSQKVTDDLSVQALAISPDHKVLASAGGFVDPDIWLWAVDSGQKIQRLKGHQTYSQALSFSADGKSLASASASASGDQTIRIWDVSDPASPGEKGVLRGHRGEVHSVAWVPGTTWLVSGGKDGSLWVWDSIKPKVAQGSAILRLQTPITAWRSSPDSRSVFVVGADGSVVRRFGNAFADSEPILDLGTNLSRALVSPDCKWLAAGLRNGVVELWSLEQRQPVRQLTCGTNAVFPWAFVEGAKHLLVTHWTNSTQVYEEWNLSTGHKEADWPGPSFWYPFPGCDTVSRDERWCLSCGYPTASYTNRVILHDRLRGSELGANLTSGGLTTWGAISPVSSEMVLGDNWGRISVWQIPSFKKVWEFSGFLQAAHSVAYSPDGSRLVAGGAGGWEAIRLWDSMNHREMLTFEADVKDGTYFVDTRFSPDGNLLGSRTASGGALYLWFAPSMAEIDALEAEEKGGR
jgi:serine/threonine protein kinase/WD40 repeat protein